MHDPFLKSIFADQRMVAILIRHHAREWADEIDFATLREEPNELVAGRTLERRYPDLIWSAETLDGGRVLFLIEFQRTVEPLMALRTTTYTALALEGVAKAEGPSAADRLPEFVCLVLYHGERPWNAPDRVADLFERSDPGEYRLVSWAETAEESGESRRDLAALVLGLARSVSARDMAARVWALRAAVNGHGDEDLDEFLFEGTHTILRLRGYKEVLTQLREKTMDEMAEKFQRSLDDLVQEGKREGIEQGARRGRTQVLRRQAARRFGEDTAAHLSTLLDELADPKRIDEVTDALIECGTGEEFIERVRMA